MADRVPRPLPDSYKVMGLPPLPEFPTHRPLDRRYGSLEPRLMRGARLISRMGMRLPAISRLRISTQGLPLPHRLSGAAMGHGLHPQRPTQLIFRSSRSRGHGRNPPMRRYPMSTR